MPFFFKGQSDSEVDTIRQVIEAHLESARESIEAGNVPQQTLLEELGNAGVDSQGLQNNWDTIVDVFRVFF